VRSVLFRFLVLGSGFVEPNGEPRTRTELRNRNTNPERRTWNRNDCFEMTEFP